MQNKRERELFLIAGTNGTGKTTFILNLIEKKKERCIYFVPDFADKKNENIKTFKNFDFVGIRKMLFTNENLSLISQAFKNGSIVFDDVKFMLPQNLNSNKDFYNLLIRRRQKNIDLYFIAHGLTEVPPKLWTFLNYLILFKTHDNIIRLKNYILNYELVLYAQKKINKVKSMHENIILKL